MVRWTILGLMGAACVAAACGDDSVEGTGGSSGGGTPASSSSGSDTTATTTSTGTSGDGGAGGAGDGGSGGTDPGSGGAGGNLLGGCAGPGECGADERCEFRDGLCGAGEPGVCMPRNDACGDLGPERVCLCSGDVVDADWTCDDDDADTTGSCALEATDFACGDAVCERVAGAFCRVTSDDTGGADYFSCGLTEEETCDDVPTCDCLSAEIDACGGTCEDGDDGATVRCPGG